MRREPIREGVTFADLINPAANHYAKRRLAKAASIWLNGNPNHALKNHSHLAQIWKSGELI
jgi:hypothetical protein